MSKEIDLTNLNKVYQVEFGHYLVQLRLTDDGFILDIFDISKGIDNPKEIKSIYYFWFEVFNLLTF